MNMYEHITELTKKGIPMVIVSVIDKIGAGPVEVGKKMLVTNTDKQFGTVGGGALEYSAREYCKTILETKKSVSKTYNLNEGEIVEGAETLPMECGGKVTLFFEYNGANEYIYIFGAGHVGQATTNILKTMNYHVTVIDEREAVINQFKGGDNVILSSFTDYIEEHGIKENSFVIVCTPSHKHDYNVINKVIEKKINVRYIGMLCSPQKLMDYIDKTYTQFGTNINLKNFYSPIGLNLGGGSPEEIAISITSEILAVSNGRENHNHMRGLIENDSYHYWKN